MKVDTHVLYPEMMKVTNLLIVDYNVLRYHSFDWIRYKMMDLAYFDGLSPSYSFLKTETNLANMIHMAKNTITSADPMSVFKQWCEPNSHKFPEDLTKELIQMFNSNIERVTMTDLSKRIGIIFGRGDIHGFVVKFKSDKKTEYDLPNNVKIVESDDMFNIDWLLNFIISNNINAVMVDSVDLAIALAMKTPIQTSFMFGTYRYNFQMYYKSDTVHMPIVKGVRQMNVLEFKRKHEFGTFDPFGDLTEYERRKYYDANPINGD